MNLRTLTTCWLMTLLWANAVNAGAVIYVDADSPGGDGSSWAAAFKYLQDALAIADVNDEIRLAQGIYVPDRSSANPTGSGDRLATFQLISGVAIRGGYAGYGRANPDERDVDSYETVLSGDLNGNDASSSSAEQLLDEPTRSDNCYHVVTSQMMMSETAVLDGLTIACGHADDIDYPGNHGGGMYKEQDSSMIIDCTFRDNCARFAGGGIYCSHLDFSGVNGISNSVFIGNSAHAGAGIFNDHIFTVLNVSDCVFTRNFAGDRGGGMYNLETDVNVVNSVFSNNSAANEGGGVFNRHGLPKFESCIISGNFAEHNGGGVCDDYLHLNLANCTIIGNEAGEQGGGLFQYYGRDINVTNCIVWDNRAYEGSQMAVSKWVNAFIRYSCFEGGWLDIHGEGTVSWADGNNTDADPMFVDPGYWDAGVWVEGDHHLRWDSPCINAGDPGADYTGQVDMDGEPRVMGGRVDMGADEVGEKQADFTRDGIIDLNDFSIFSQVWPENMPYDELCVLCDLLEDEQINALDLAEFVEDWLWKADWYEPDPNDRVDYIDMKFLAESWLMQQALLSEDLDRDVLINSKDFALFAEQWLWEQ